MTRLGVVYPTRVSIWRREQRAKVLVEAPSTNSFEGACWPQPQPGRCRHGDVAGRDGAGRKGRDVARAKTIRHRIWRPAGDRSTPGVIDRHRGQGSGGRSADRRRRPGVRHPLAMCAWTGENAPAPNAPGGALLQGTRPRHARGCRHRLGSPSPRGRREAGPAGAGGGEAGHHDPSQDPAPGAEPRTVPPDARTHAPGTSVTG